MSVGKKTKTRKRKRKNVNDPDANTRRKLRNNSTVPGFTKSICIKTNDLFD